MCVTELDLVLEIDWLTQVDSDPGSDLYPLDCLAASTAMGLNYYGSDYRVDDISRAFDAVRPLLPGGDGYVGYHILAPVVAWRNLGWSTRFDWHSFSSGPRGAEHLNEAKLISMLQRGWPIVAYIRTGALPPLWRYLGESENILHFVLIHGIRDRDGVRRLYYLDPNWPRASQGRCWLPLEKFDLAWSAAGGTPRQGLVVRPT